MQKDPGRLPTQGGFQRRNAKGLLEGGGKAFLPRERHGWRRYTVTTPPTRRKKGLEGRMWRRTMAEAAKGFRNQITVGMEEPFLTSPIYSHLAPQMFWNICLNHLVTLLITYPSVMNSFLHVDGSYLLLTGFGCFLCDWCESQVLNEYFSNWVEVTPCEDLSKTQYK